MPREAASFEFEKHYMSSFEAQEECEASSSTTCITLLETMRNSKRLARKNPELSLSMNSIYQQHRRQGYKADQRDK